jgi:predicted DNA-binding protein
MVHAGLIHLREGGADMNELAGVACRVAMYDTYIVKRTQIYLEADQDRRLATRATASGVTKSTLIREAIETYLATPDEADQLAQFRSAIDAVADAPAQLPDGATYVESIRAADVARQDELDERRG